MKRKWKGWSIRERWEWEKTETVAVFSIDDKTDKQKPSVITELQKLLEEFSIPLDVIDGDSKHGEDFLQIEDLLRRSMKDNKVDYEMCEEELWKVRGEGRLPYGVVILIDEQRYEFRDPPGQRERAIYGIGVSDGLVILRHTHREAVRHEFGHMLGLGHHHPAKSGCIMNWECATVTLCDDCRHQIKEMWQKE